MKKKYIILIGAGGHAQSCIDVIEQQKKFIIKGLFDKNNKNKTIFGYKNYGDDKKIKFFKKKIKYALITLGQIKTSLNRKKLFDYCEKLGFKFPVIISPQAYVSPKSQIGSGTIIMHGAVVNSGAVIGRNCVINSNALVEHGSIVKDNCHISTGAILNGNTTVNENCFIGSGVVTKQNITIGKMSVISINNLIEKNLPDHTFKK